ncbi:MAG TPA: lanthionine synthetase C family protein, partial [Thermoanaerobaculia bacterium]
MRAIAAALRSPSFSFGTEASLASGLAGIALFDAYCGLAAGGDDATAALDRLDGAIDALGELAAPRPSLYSGYAGVAWAAAHLAARLGVAGDATAEVDEALREHLATAPPPQSYDLLDGFTGIGVYALERLPEPAGVALLAGVIDRLVALAETDDDGVTWWSDPATFPEADRGAFPDGYYNLGVAHGVPAVVALLGRAVAAGVREDVARRLLDGAVPWLLAHQLPDGADGAFPYHHRSGRPPRPARLAWCYGDAGIAVALLGAARAVGEPGWESAALAIAARAAGRDEASARVTDAGLCHGACGLGHLFNRLHQATGDDTFAAAARRWFERGLAMRVPSTGVGGYSALLPGADGAPPSPVADPGFLLGAAGVGLALVAATSDVEPSWDRLLL